MGLEPATSESPVRDLTTTPPSHHWLAVYARVPDPQYICACFKFAALDDSNVHATHHIEALKGDTVLLWCNTTSGGVIWTQWTPDDGFGYLYINGTFTTITTTRYSIEERQDRDEYSLKIYNAQVPDTGRYDCWEHDQVRRFGYDLNVTGKKKLEARFMKYLTIILRYYLS